MMTTTQRRIALLTGASLATLVTSVPAFAATEPSTPINNTGPSVTDSETICVDLSPDSPDCLFGVSNTGTGLVTSTVNSPATGQLQYTNTATGVGGDVTATLTGDATATVSAFASATGLGANTANAAVSTGIQFRGTAPDQVTLTFDNEAPTAINAIANATGATANAGAQVAVGMLEFGSGADVTLNATNNASFTALASANATATGAPMRMPQSASCMRSRCVRDGRGGCQLHQCGHVQRDRQRVRERFHRRRHAVASRRRLPGCAGPAGGLATSANVHLSNAGAMNLNANANASATSGKAANAAVGIGIMQGAGATGTAVARPDQQRLDRHRRERLCQRASCSGTRRRTAPSRSADRETVGRRERSASITNDAAATIGIDAAATATGFTVNAVTAASGNNPLIQRSDPPARGRHFAATSAALNLANSGTVAIGASANAAASPARRSPTLPRRLLQNIDAATIGTAHMYNNATLGVTAVANAPARSPPPMRRCPTSSSRT